MHARCPLDVVIEDANHYFLVNNGSRVRQPHQRPFSDVVFLMQLVTEFNNCGIKIPA